MNGEQEGPDSRTPGWYNDRFAELMELEFGASTQSPTEPEVPRPEVAKQDELDQDAGGAPDEAPASVLFPPPASAIGPRDFALIDDDDDSFVLPEPEPHKGLTGWGVAVVLLLGMSVLIALALLLHMVMPDWIPGLGLACFVAGVGIGFWRLPRHHDPRNGNGAVV